MKSSYEENNYGEVFSNIVEVLEPALCVELGVLGGYSTISIAEQLRKNGHGQLEAYDLFEDYPYNHTNQEAVRTMMEKNYYGIFQDVLKIEKADAFEVYENYSPGSVHLLHVDLSNTGETIIRIMEQWDSKMVYGGVILFEGGTKERDEIEWMVKYKKPGIKKEIETNPIIQEKYIYGTYLPFPGLTHLVKKR